LPLLLGRGGLPEAVQIAMNPMAEDSMGFDRPVSEVHHTHSAHAALTIVGHSYPFNATQHRRWIQASTARSDLSYKHLQQTAQPYLKNCGAQVDGRLNQSHDENVADHVSTA
jgi:hypothetical protein